MELATFKFGVGIQRTITTKRKKMKKEMGKHQKFPKKKSVLKKNGKKPKGKRKESKRKNSDRKKPYKDTSGS